MQSLQEQKPSIPRQGQAVELIARTEKADERNLHSLLKFRLAIVSSYIKSLTKLTMPFLYFRSSALIALACLVSHASGHKHYYDDHEEHFSHFHHDGAVHDHRELSGVERCSTPVLSPGQRYEDNQKVAAWRKSNGCTIDSCPMLEAFPETTISVYWHSMQTSSGTGGITTQMITDSMSVLNAAYAASGFSFALMQTTVTDNDDYYYSLAGPKATAMKTALRQGDASTLNIYSTGIDTISSALGSATFPSEYASEPLEDGVVIGSNTAPGGNKAPYNRGNTLVHEVGHWMGLLHVFSGGCEGG